MAWHTWPEDDTHHAQSIHQYYCDNRQYQKQQYYHHQEQHYHRHHFSHPSRPPLKGTLVLFPPSWDTLSEFLKELAALGPKIPCRKRLVLYFVFRGTSLRVCLGDGKFLIFFFLILIFINQLETNFLLFLILIFI